jgi:glycosyltransferase involved in cell wall biosynthesis
VHFKKVDPPRLHLKDAQSVLKLVVIHYHLRPGGIRRIIELAAPHLALQFGGRVESIVVASGEAGDRKWNEYFVGQLRPIPVRFFVDPSFNYVSEQKLPVQRLTKQVRTGVGKLLAGADARNCLVWSHNPGIARNLVLTRELARATAARNIPLVAHHHDWWFDNRWLRWPEMRRFGFRSLASAARTIFPSEGNVCHVAINHSDAAVLQRHFPERADWLPNLAERGRMPEPRKMQAIRDWLAGKLADGDAPVWILPCRLLRRKNIAEALLLTRWLRPEAWLVTTGGASSVDERHYTNKLSIAAHRHHWRLRLGILQGDETGKPGVAELLAVSEAVMLTSIQEGFGLPYLEAAAAQRPLIARVIPNIAPDLKRFGFRFPQYYDELLIDPRLFDWRAERNRQASLFGAWKRRLPGACRRWVGHPVVLKGERPRAAPFSRLTLTAQIEVLAQPTEESWTLCVPLNPFLSAWKKRAVARRLATTPWPRAAGNWLSGDAYARRFRRIILTGLKNPLRLETAVAAQENFIREKLGADHLFPLLWSRNS